MKTTIGSIVTLVCMMIGGCHKSAPVTRADNTPAKAAGCPLPPAPTVHFEPSDLSSAVSQEAFKVFVDNRGEAVGQDVLETLAKAISLEDWPERRQSVALSVTVHDSSGELYGPTGFRRSEPAYIEVRPVNAVPDGWHVLRVAALPPSLEWHRARGFAVFADGSRGARLNRASAPVLKSVSVCPKGEDEVVDVEFSEPVVASATDLVLTRPSSDPCTRAASVENEASVHRFSCRRGLFLSEEARLDLAQSIRSKGGQPLNGSASSVELLTRAKFSKNGNCHVMRR